MVSSDPWVSQYGPWLGNNYTNVTIGEGRPGGGGGRRCWWLLEIGWCGKLSFYAHFGNFINSLVNSRRDWKYTKFILNKQQKQVSAPSNDVYIKRPFFFWVRPQAWLFLEAGGRWEAALSCLSVFSILIIVDWWNSTLINVVVAGRSHLAWENVNCISIRK